MSKCLVTGSAGFIGSHLVDKLLELEHEVIGVDDLSTGKKENLNPKARFIELDVNNIYRVTGKVDYVFHLAAIPRMPFSIEYPVKTHNANVNGTLKLLNWSRDRVEKFIFASSSSVYGGKIPMKETNKLDPQTPYALHKLIGEQYCKLYNDLYEVPTVALRFFNVYGTRADPDSEYSLVIAKFKKLIEEKEATTIFGDGKQTRDFTYISDVVNACITVMDKGEGVYNVCNGKGTSINKIADLLGGKKEYFPPREGDVKHTLGDNKKLRKLGWKPKVSIKEGIESL